MLGNKALITEAKPSHILHVRKNVIGGTADVAKAFLQINITLKGRSL